MSLGKLSNEAKSLWKSVYKANGSVEDAWLAVKSAGWKKTIDGWQKKSDLVEFPMYITKSVIHKGVMTWASVNSDTDPDSYNEQMSLELYKSFIENIKTEKSLPAMVKSEACSEFWCGGMPYLSLSHYPDLNGFAVPGEPLEIYVDGNQLKAKGILNNTPLGNAVWRSLKEDKDKEPEDKIRISIGFLDIAHKHGVDGSVWVRDSAFALCPECLQGVGRKIYVKGYLVHLALTRVPVNKRTEMVLEEKSMAKKKITRKDDAASIVGKELAEEIEVKQKASTQRSDALVELSETEEETQELVNEVSEPVEEAVAEEVAEPVEEAAEDVVEEVAVEEKSDAVVEKFEDETMSAVVNEVPEYADHLPLGGAVTMESAEKFMESKNEAIYVSDTWSVFSTVAYNILDRADIVDKREAMVKAIDGFKNLLTVKAMVVFSAPVKEEHPLQVNLNELLSAIEASVNKSEDERAEVLNPMLQNLAPAITNYIESKSMTEVPVPTNKDDSNSILDEIRNLLQPIGEKVALLSEEVGVLKSQASASNVEARNRIPAPRTAMIAPSLQQKAEVANKSTTPTLRSIIEKSVGL